MKIRLIDILNKKEDGTLEDGFQFKLIDKIWTYDKYEDWIVDNKCYAFDEQCNVIGMLNEEVEVISNFINLTGKNIIKIIDILNKMADETLEDGFKFKDDNIIWRYDKSKGCIVDNKNYSYCKYCSVSEMLDRKVEVIEK